ncbi:50S ribosomal protein L22 [Candidatus Azambacteria bacterium]|nr:50S ribosomal protein L22 [Candidatus Azambacteria bacterium]
MQYKFHLNNLRMAPRKVRRVAALIKKLPVEEAETQLKFRNMRAALPILKLLKSGAASANNNFNLPIDNLYVSNIFVDEGQMLKRFMPRAFGRAGAIHKKTSHITLVLEEKIPGVKKAKKKVVKEIGSKAAGMKKAESAEEKKPSFAKTEGREAPKEIKPRRKSEGVARKIFRRKAIG